MGHEFVAQFLLIKIFCYHINIIVLIKYMAGTASRSFLYHNYAELMFLKVKEECKRCFKKDFECLVAGKEYIGEVDLNDVVCYKW